MLQNLPAVGWSRQRKKKQSIAEKLAQAAQTNSRMSRFAQQGQGRGPRSGRPFQGRGGAQRFAAMSRRPMPMLAALRGPGVHGKFGQISGGGPAIRVGPPPHAPSPQQLQGTLGGGFAPPGAGGQGSAPAAPHTPFGGSSGNPAADAALMAAEQTYGTPDNPSALSQGVQDSAMGVNPGTQLSDIIPGYQAPGAGGFTAGGMLGNFIPLGGGLYMDGQGNIFGAGGAY